MRTFFEEKFQSLPPHSPPPTSFSLCQLWLLSVAAGSPALPLLPFSPLASHFSISLSQSNATSFTVSKQVACVLGDQKNWQEATESIFHGSDLSASQQSSEVLEGVCYCWTAVCAQELAELSLVMVNSDLHHKMCCHNWCCSQCPQRPRTHISTHKAGSHLCFGSRNNHCTSVSQSLYRDIINNLSWKVLIQISKDMHSTWKP